MAQISLVKTLVLSYMELQRQIDTHHIDAPSYVLRALRDQQAAILASLEAKEPIELAANPGIDETRSYWATAHPEAKEQFEQLLESQKEEEE